MNAVHERSPRVQARRLTDRGRLTRRRARDLARMAQASAALRGAARAAPRERDRFMDLLRVASLVVVAGHWLAVMPFVRGGVVGDRMVFDVPPSLWPLTWVFQVIPLFFFVGGFANFTSFTTRQDRESAEQFRTRRMTRLLRPTLVFLGAWVAIEAILNVFNLGGDRLLRGVRVATSPHSGPSGSWVSTWSSCC